MKKILIIILCLFIFNMYLFALSPAGKNINSIFNENVINEFNRQKIIDECYVYLDMNEGKSEVLYSEKRDGKYESIESGHEKYKYQRSYDKKRNEEKYKIVKNEIIQSFKKSGISHKVFYDDKEFKIYFKYTFCGLKALFRLGILKTGLCIDKLFKYSPYKRRYILTKPKKYVYKWRDGVLLKFTKKQRKIIEKTKKIIKDNDEPKKQKFKENLKGWSIKLNEIEKIIEKTYKNGKTNTGLFFGEHHDEIEFKKIIIENAKKLKEKYGVEYFFIENLPEETDDFLRKKNDVPENYLCWMDDNVNKIKEKDYGLSALIKALIDADIKVISLDNTYTLSFSGDERVRIGNIYFKYKIEKVLKDKMKNNEKGNWIGLLGRDHLNDSCEKFSGVGERMGASYIIREEDVSDVSKKYSYYA